MDAIKQAVIDLMQRLKAKKSGICADDPRVLLKKVLTKKELAHIRFNYFRKGVLGLNVDSSGWLYSFSLKKPGLLAGLNKKSRAIKDIRFRIGEVR